MKAAPGLPAQHELLHAEARPKIRKAALPTSESERPWKQMRSHHASEWFCHALVPPQSRLVSCSPERDRRVTGLSNVLDSGATTKAWAVPEYRRTFVKVPNTQPA